MIQMDLEQRQSSRFARPFLVTDHEDTGFEAPFSGFDINLTGVGFVVNSDDLFLPDQQISLRVKNVQTDEVYCLEGVEVVHIVPKEDGFICGCHISRVTSGQLLAHHRLVMTDAETALVSMETSKLSEFNFVEEGSALSTDEADFQEASLALNLAVAQAEHSQKEFERFLTNVESIFRLEQGSSEKLTDLKYEFEDFRQHYLQTCEGSLAFTTLAKLLAHTPNKTEEKLAWKTLISDFESRFLSESQQVAYDFMHQGLDAEEAMEVATDYVDRSNE